MPNFLGRPNVPNSLANSLVQLAAAEQDPLALALGQVGKLADNYTAYQTNMKLLEKKSELDNAQAEKQHGRAKELRKMDTDAAIFEKLLSNDRIIGGLMGDKGMSRADADGLLAGVQTPSAKTRQTVEGDFGKRQDDAGEGTPLSQFGVKIPGDPRVTASKEKVKIDADMAKRFGLPNGVVGKTLTMDQVVSLRRSEGSGKTGRDPDKLKLAEQIVNRNPDMIEADLPTRMAAIDAAYDALATIKEGGAPAGQTPEEKAAAEAKKTPKKKGASIFGFSFGGDEAPAKPAAPASETEESVRADYQAKKITKEQAREKIKAIRAASMAKK